MREPWRDALSAASPKRAGSSRVGSTAKSRALAFEPRAAPGASSVRDRGLILSQLQGSLASRRNCAFVWGPWVTFVRRNVRRRTILLS